MYPPNAHENLPALVVQFFLATAAAVVPCQNIRKVPLNSTLDALTASHILYDRTDLQGKSRELGCGPGSVSGA